MWARLRKIVKSVSGRIMICLLLLIAPLNILASFQAKEVYNNAIVQVKSSKQNVLNVHMKALEERMENAASLLLYFQREDTDCLAMALQTETNSHKYIGAKQKLYRKVLNMGSMIDGAQGYFYYFPKVEDIFVQSVSSPYIGRDTVAKLRTAIMNDGTRDTYGGWHLYEGEDGAYAILYVELKNVYCGAWIELSEIETQIQKDMEFENYHLKFYEEDMEIEKDSHMLYVTGQAKKIKLQLGINEEEIIQVKAKFPQIMLLAANLYIALIPFLYLLIRRIMITPLQGINHAHRQLQQGNQDYRLPEWNRTSEFEEAYQSFNDMADNLKKLRIQAYEEKIEKQQIELRNLQLQIRPHFLLNSFNLIYMLLEKRKLEPIQEILIYLSEYFRYIFRSGKQTELFHKELNMIHGYISMAAVRYENLVELSEDFDPELEFVRTPPLLIHNFVENAVKHGFTQGKMLNIEITGRYDAGWVSFQISDNGKGMKADVLERNRQIFAGKLVPKEKGQHLGLFNSYKRLKYFYGEEAYIDVISEPDEITCFTICFPYNLEVDEDEAADCE